ncbi:unnamed protein product, partial [Timema podura]|nr:unnamed protein product [Timema podura]
GLQKREELLSKCKVLEFFLSDGVESDIRGAELCEELISIKDLMPSKDGGSKMQSMSSENSTMYFPPIPPALPLEPLLVNKPLITNYSSPMDPQEELLEARDKLRLREGLKEAPRILSYKYVAPILQDGPK